MSTTAMQRGGGGGYVQRSSSAGLYEILDLLLDKGLVVDVFLRVSLVGIELLTVDARIVIASVDTYLRFAEAVNRLDLTESGGEGLPRSWRTSPRTAPRARPRACSKAPRRSCSAPTTTSDDEEQRQTAAARAQLARQRSRLAARARCSRSRVAPRPAAARSR